jgi:beta-lactamase regulating signal transducer with metallopeptidase domain
LKFELEVPRMQSIVETLAAMSASVWHASWQAACLAILVWALLSVLSAKIAARWRFILWSLVFIRLALPVLPTSPTSAFRLLRPQPPTVTVPNEVSEEIPRTSPADSFAIETEVISEGFVEEDIISPTEAARPVEPHLEQSGSQRAVPPSDSRPAASWTWSMAAAALWLIGMLMFGIRRCVQQFMLARRAKHWRQADDARIEGLAAACCRRLRIRARVSVLVSDDGSGPAITGVWRPRIVMPDAVLRDFSDEQLEMILLHELAHVRRRDLLVHEACLLLRTVHWFNPVAWWAFRRLQTEREMACDELVLDMTGGGRRQSYGLTLLQVVQQGSMPVLNPGLLGTSDPSARLQRRLVMIRSYRGRSWKSTVLAAAAIALAAMLGLTSPPAAQTQERSGGATTIEDAKGDATERSADKLPDGLSGGVEGKSFEIQGRCLDDDGKPLEGVEVCLFFFDRIGAPPTKKCEQKTGASGAYRFENLKPLTTLDEDQQHYLVAARRPKYSSSARLVFLGTTSSGLDLPLSSNVGALSGRVTDEQGEPVSGADVYLSLGGAPLPGFLHDVTDKEGRYSIADFKCWNAEDTTTSDPKSGTVERVAYCSFRVRHPEYPLTIGKYSAIPQEVNVQLKPGVTIEGRVLDIVKGEPAAGAIVTAQGIEEHGWANVVTDEKGWYRLLLTADRYNIRAHAKDRTSIALDSFEGTAGEVTKAPDLKLIAGGFIVGKVVDKATGKPVTKLPNSSHGVSVAHHGPAFPQSGAQVGGTVVQADGTYQLHVAPGPNYPYLMHDVEAERTPRNATSAEPVVVREGETVTVDFHVGPLANEEPEPQDRATPAATAERPRVRPLRPAPPGAAAKRDGEQPPRKRAETDVGRLLNRLDELRPKFAEEEWAATLRELIQLGPAAVPELIAEMDATNDEFMLRCLAFVMRGIGDKRVVPALIRSLPKTCVTPRSDYSLPVKVRELLAFMQKHDSSDFDFFKSSYTFGRAITEFRVTLQKLTGATHGENEIMFVFLDGTPRQQFLQRSLYQRCAERWAAWWEQHWKVHVDDERYAKVNLPPLADEAPALSVFPHGPGVTVDGPHSNHLLESVRNPKAKWVFHDFETRRISELPEKLRAPVGQPERLDEIAAWAAQEGFDLMGTEYTPPGGDQPHYVLRGLGLTAWQIETDRWKTLDVELRNQEPFEMGRRTDGLLASFDAAKVRYLPEETATFLFRTREGSYGAIFVGVEVHDDSLKPGGVASDDELSPIAFRKGRRFAYSLITQAAAAAKE